MLTREIFHEQWQAFFGDFTELHQEEHVNVETIREKESGPSPCLCNMALVGISSAGSKSGPDGRIDVTARDPSGSLASHSIADPSKVQLAEEHGQAVAIQIESVDGSITMIRFEPPRENMPQGFMLT